MKVLLFTFLFIAPSFAAGENYPCSKNKGGVSHCEGSKFVCNDGSKSASKKNCNDDKALHNKKVHSLTKQGKEN